MAWVAFDRAVRIAKYRNWDHLPIDKWAKLRDEVHDQVCEKGFNAAKNSFVQYYGSDQLDASLLMLARVGFLPPTDPRIIGTVEAIQRELVVDGFVLRYITQDGDSVDGLPAGEGTFLMTTFWLADNLALIGRDRRGTRGVRTPARAAATTSACSRRSTTRRRSACWGTSRRPSRTSAFVTSAAHLSMGDASPISRQSRGD